MLSPISSGKSPGTCASVTGVNRNEMPPRKTKTVAARQELPRELLACCTILCDTPECPAFFPCTQGVTHDMTWVLAFGGGWSHDAAGLRRCPACVRKLSEWNLPAAVTFTLPWDDALYQNQNLSILFGAIDAA